MKYDDIFKENIDLKTKVGMGNEMYKYANTSLCIKSIWSNFKKFYSLWTVLFSTRIELTQ